MPYKLVLALGKAHLLLPQRLRGASLVINTFAMEKKKKRDCCQIEVVVTEDSKKLSSPEQNKSRLILSKYTNLSIFGMLCAQYS